MIDQGLRNTEVITSVVSEKENSDPGAVRDPQHVALERSYPKPPKTVFAAFCRSGPKRSAGSLKEKVMNYQQFEVDFRVGGTAAPHIQAESGHAGSRHDAHH